MYLKNGIFISFAEAPCNDDFPECMRVCFLATTDWTKEDCKEECCKGGPLVKKKGKANINLLKQGYLPVIGNNYSQLIATCFSNKKHVIL